MPKKTNKEKTEEQKKLHIEVVRQMLTLATSGFGLVAALAWNSLIQEFVAVYIKEWLPDGKMISLLVYALVVTVLAVIVTLQLSRLLKKVDPNAELKK
jgi:Na+/melibiose symporter-like transporter